MDPAAVALARKGGLVGGKALAEKLTPEHRAEIGRNVTHLSLARLAALKPARRVSMGGLLTHAGRLADDHR